MERTSPIARLRSALLAASLLLGVHPVAAQIPSKLLHTILPPPVGVQAGASLGYSVAIDGGLAVAGAPFDDLGKSQSGVVKVFNSSTEELLHVLINPDPDYRDFFGKAVAISGTRVVVGAYADDTGTADSGSAFVYDLAGATPTIPVATLRNPSPASGDLFGFSVGIDGSLVVVGAPFDDTGASDAGSAYVYDIAGTLPTEPAVTLNNPSPDVNDHFGRSVAISGTRIITGAIYDGTGSNRFGSAHVFDLASATPAAPVFTLSNPGLSNGAYFGGSVAISGTLVIVGAPRNYVGATIAGKAYIYDLAGEKPTKPTLTVDNPTPAAEDLFGNSVAISGTRFVVGAHTDDTGATSAGSAYVYDLNVATPAIPVLTLGNPEPAPHDQFGLSVSISGAEVLVGAPFDDTGATNTGSAYIYHLGGATSAIPATILNHPGRAAYEDFGSSVALSGSLLLVGAPQDDTGAVDAGSAYVFDLLDGTPTIPDLALHNPEPSPSDNFGKAIAISGNRCVIAATGDDTGAHDSGSAYIYDLTSPAPGMPVATLRNPVPSQGASYGCSVAIFGNLVVVGACFDDAGALDAGSSYVYDLSGPTPTFPILTLHNPRPSEDAYFGYSVAISSERVIVGALLDDTAAEEGGTVYVYELASATPALPVATLNCPEPMRDDGFGISVAIDGPRIIVGAHLDDPGEYDAGSAYVYDLDGPTPLIPIATLNNPTPEYSDRFGQSVAISGTRVAVGCYGDDTGMTDVGRAYVYEISGTKPEMTGATLKNPAPDIYDRFGWSVAISGSLVAIGTQSNNTVKLVEGAVYIFAPDPDDLDADGLPDAWELTYWPVKEDHAPLDDDDHDGYCELLELALGLNPTVSDPGGLPEVFEEDGYLTVTLAKVAGVAYEVQTAGTLEAGKADSFSAASTTVLVDDPATLTVRGNVPVGTPPGRYLRVKVTVAP